MSLDNMSRVSFNIRDSETVPVERPIFFGEGEGVTRCFDLRI